MHSSSENGFLGNHFEQATIEVGAARAALNDAADFLRATRSTAPGDAGAERASDDPHVILRFGQLQARLHAAQGLLARAKRAQTAASAGAHVPTSNDPATVVAAIQARAFATDLLAEIVSQVLAWGGPLPARDPPLDINGQRIQNANHWNYHYAGNYYLKGVGAPNSQGNDSGPQNPERHS
jgi:alkylation response protein AidB-like acyl-CoA dehydrogenase